MSSKNGSVEVIENVCDLDKTSMRENIFALEEMMKDQEQVEIPVNHFFHAGMYCREIVIPKDTIITGRIHKFDHFDIMLSGEVVVTTDDGEPKTLTGFNIMPGKAGKKRAGYTIKETHWITVHCAEERDPDEMVDFLTVGSFEELEEFNVLLANAMKQLGGE